MNMFNVVRDAIVIGASALLLCGCVSASDNEFVVGLAVTQNGLRPLSTDMGGMHIMGEGTPLY